MKEIFTRRSVRQYSDKAISENDLMKIIEAGMAAPSARNQQPAEYIVIKDKNNISNVSGVSKNAGFIKDANILICLVSKPTSMLTTPDMVEQDLALQMENMMLEACHLGIGSCYIGVYPKEDRMSFLTKELNISDGYFPFALLSLGYPLKEDAFKKVEREFSSRIHKEKF